MFNRTLKGLVVSLMLAFALLVSPVPQADTSPTEASMDVTTAVTTQASKLIGTQAVQAQDRCTVEVCVEFDLIVVSGEVCVSRETDC